MAAARLLLAVLAFAPCSWCERPRSIGAPSYSTDSIVNAADGRADRLGANTLASIFGKDLSYNTRALAASDILGNRLPTMLGGVRVNFSGIYLPLLYVSPTQINFLLPYDHASPELDVWVERDNTRGPKVRIQVAPVAPAMFRLDERTVIATHLDGSLVAGDSPARGGEVVILYATGLGRTLPDQTAGNLAVAAAALAPGSGFSVRLGGAALPPDRVWYAGVAPGYAGLYQINLQLPDDPGKDPEISVAIGEQVSSGGLRLITSSNP